MHSANKGLRNASHELQSGSVLCALPQAVPDGEPVVWCQLEIVTDGSVPLRDMLELQQAGAGSAQVTQPLPACS